MRGLKIICLKIRQMKTFTIKLWLREKKFLSISVRLTREDSQRKVRDSFDNDLQSWSNTCSPQIFFQNGRMIFDL
jgi:hypothetical protein